MDLAFSRARVRWGGSRLSREPPIEGRRVGRACASSRLATWPSAFRNLSSHSVRSRVSTLSALPSNAEFSYEGKFRSGDRRVKSRNGVEGVNPMSSQFGPKS